ncbi:MAG: DsrE family protein, partial [Pseudoalteromonas sp.]
MKSLFLAVALTLVSFIATAEQSEPIIKDFGRFYEVPNHAPIDKQTKFKVAFDVGGGAEKGAKNNYIDSLARFINLHVAHGVKLENIQLALVVHGGASVDVL